MLEKVKALLNRDANADRDESADGPRVGSGGERQLGSAAAGALRDALKVLRVESEDLFERAFAYVEDGVGPELLSELAGRDTAMLNVALGSPAETSWRYFYGSTADKVKAAVRGWTIQKGSKARGRLYSGKLLDAGHYARLGRLMAAIVPEVSHGPAVPDWFAVLVNDLCTTDDLPDAARHASVSPSVAGGRKAWTPALLAEVLVAGGVAPGATAPIIAGVLFDLPKPDRGYYGYPARVLLAQPGLGEFLAAERVAVTDVVLQAKAPGKGLFLERLAGHDDERDAYLDLVARLAVDAAKTVRTEALGVFAGAAADLRIAAAEPLLTTVGPTRLTTLAAHLVGVDGGRDALRRALEGATGSRATILGQALQRAELLGPAPAGADGGSGSAGAESAGEGSGGAPELVIPPYEPLVETPLGDDFVAAARTAIDAALARARAEQTEFANLSAAARQDESWREQMINRQVKTLSGISDAELRAAVDFLSGRAGVARRNRALPALRLPAVRSALPALTFLHELLLAGPNVKGNVAWQIFQETGIHEDLRAIADYLGRSEFGDPHGQIERLVFHTWHVEDMLEPDQIWPYFAEQPEALERALGLRAGATGAAAGHQREALAILAEFPVIPARYLPALSDLALGEGKTHRRAAQDALEKHHAARPLAEQGLGSGKAEVRAAAADWLMRLGDPAAVPALRAALSAERRETVRAVLLSALERVGDDIGPDLAPDALAAEAAKGLRAKPPAGLAWFPYEALPTVRWADGVVVPADVIRWWVVLACKLKDPSGTGLIGRYMSLLEPASQAALGRFVLAAWIGQDTRHPSVEESRAHADAGAQARYDRYQHWNRNYPQYYAAEAAKTVDQHFQDLFREHQATFLGSAVAEKGLLALTVGMPGAELAAAAQTYWTQYIGRRAQTDALVSALAANGQPAALQVLLGVARRFRQPTVQARAAALVAEIAERRGWSAEQLADRTVPTAGFDDDGVLRLDLGSRVFLGRITADFGLEVTSPEGKVVKALSVRKDDDPEAAKAAKAQLTAARKDLKQVVAGQRARLYEAMCAGRRWSAAEWTEYVLGHPILSRLAATLVWLENPGPQQRAFRPGDAGALIDVDDADVVLAPDAEVALAHVVLVGSAAATAWREHLRDYEVDQVFDQFGAEPPAAAPTADSVVDRRGWFSDSFKIRGRALKLGYARGVGGDGGWFDEYTKDHPSLDLRAVIGFTGSMLPEENIPAAVIDLSFRSLGRRQGTTKIRLGHVPPVLLAEAYRDYVTVAEAGAFDPNWERNSRW